MTRRTPLLRLALPGLAALLLLPAPAAAQAVPSAELSIGWRLLHAMDVIGADDETFPAGWYADIGINVTDAIALVGDVAGAYKSFDERITQFGIPIDATADLAVHSFLGGVRFSARQNPRVVPFAQVLFGLTRVSADLEGSTTVGGRQITVSESESSNEFAFEAGGGVNLNLWEGLIVRAGGSYLRVGAEDGGNAFRLTAGVVLPF